MSLLSRRARTPRGTVRRSRTPAEVHAHHSAINEIVARWQDGEYGKGDAALATKRALIEEENRFYLGTPLPEAPAEPPERPVLALVQGRFFEEDEDEKEPWWQR
jgi:hypothetical protein